MDAGSQVIVGTVVALISWATSFFIGIDVYKFLSDLGAIIFVGVFAAIAFSGGSDPVAATNALAKALTFFANNLPGIIIGEVIGTIVGAITGPHK